MKLQRQSMPQTAHAPLEKHAPARRSCHLAGARGSVLDRDIIGPYHQNPYDYFKSDCRTMCVMASQELAAEVARLVCRNVYCAA